MSRYRKVEVATWTDERFRELSPAPPNAQTLWLYLLTGQRTTALPGLVIANELVMASDLGWSVEAFREAFAEVFAKGMAEASWKGGLVVLTKALLDSTGEPRETAKPQSPNVIRSWAKAWDEVPDCDLKTKYLLRLESFSKALGEGFSKAFTEAFRKALAKASRHPSPIQEQDTGAGTGTGGSGLSSPPAAATGRASKPVRPPKVRPPVPPEAEAAARRLLDRICANTPASTLARLPESAKRDRAQKWAGAFRLLHERDGHSWEDINAMVDWCQADPFWKSNILSGDKLREKWDQLAARRTGPRRAESGLEAAMRIAEGG